MFEIIMQRSSKGFCYYLFIFSLSLEVTCICKLICILFFVLVQEWHSEKKNPILIIFLTCSNLSIFWANLFLWDFVIVTLLKKEKKGVLFVILFVGRNLPRNFFLSHWMEGKHLGQGCLPLIIFPLQHSQVQFISKTMYVLSMHSASLWASR